MLDRRTNTLANLLKFLLLLRYQKLSRHKTLENLYSNTKQNISLKKKIDLQKKYQRQLKFKDTHVYIDFVLITLRRIKSLIIKFCFARKCKLQYNAKYD